MVERPGQDGEYHAAINMTYAEMAKKYGTRDMLIYEMYNLSQFSDGSVLNAITMLTYTAEQVRDSYKTGMPDYKLIDGLLGFPDAATGMMKLIKSIYDDLRRNARAAIKTGGHTKNLAPRVK